MFVAKPIVLLLGVVLALSTRGGALGTPRVRTRHAVTTSIELDSNPNGRISSKVNRNFAGKKNGLLTDPRSHLDPSLSPYTDRPFTLPRGERHEGELCPVCENFLMPLLDNLGSDEGALEKALNATCATVVPEAGGLRKECEEAVSGIPRALSSAGQSLTQKYSVREVCAILSLCEVSCCLVPIQPEQVRLSLTGKAGEVAITWITRNVTDGDPAVHISTERRVDDKPFNESYPTFRSVVADAGRATITSGVNGWRGFIHTVVVSNLTRDTRYWYAVGDSAHANGQGGPTVNYWSRPSFSFVLPPPAGANETVRVGVIGDMGASDISDGTAFRLTEARENGEIDLLLGNGDLSYADMAEYLDDDFGRKMEPVAAYVPFLTTAGNHEAFFRFRAMAARYANPLPWQRLPDASGAPTRLYYSFDSGPVHFVAINTESNGDAPGFFPPDSPQYIWISADLARVDRSVTPWVVVFGHRPFYCAHRTSSSCAITGVMFRKWLEPLLLQAKVDLVLEAHKHSYARMYPVANGTRVSTSYDSPGAPVYIVQGAAGNMEGQDSVASDPFDYVASQSQRFGYSVFEATGERLSWKFFSSDDNTVIDSVAITK